MANKKKKIGTIRETAPGVLKTEIPGTSEIVPPVESEFGEVCYVICLVPSTKQWAAYRRSGTGAGIKYEKLTPSSDNRIDVALALSEHLVKHGR